MRNILVDIEVDIPFTKYWFDIDINKEFAQIEIREFYIPDPETQKLLGEIDTRPILKVVFRLFS